jgi:hypothetical protein
MKRSAEKSIEEGRQQFESMKQAAEQALEKKNKKGLWSFKR